MRTYRNAILSSLSAATLSRFERDLERVSLALNEVISRADADPRHVYFLESGIAAVTVVSSAGRSTVVGLHGRDGMGPVPAVLGLDRAPQQTAS